MTVLLANQGGGGPGTDWTLDLSDTLTLTDATAKDVVQSLIDSIAFTDGVGKDITTAPSDTLTLSDSVGAKDYGQNLGDAVTFTDTVSGKDYEQNLSDVLSLVDEVSNAYGMSRSDAISFIDGFTTDWPVTSVTRLRMLMGLGQ